MSFIDIHHHLVGKQHPPNMPEWSMEIDEDAMDRIGITGVLVSLPVAGNPEQTRGINNMIASMAKKNSSKYGMLACLPSTYVEEALEEIDYACDTLKVDGFSMPTNACGIYVGDDRMNDILEELDKRSAVVLLHPTKPYGDVPSLYVTDLSVYEYPFETTRAIMDLIYRGKIQKYPNIRWIISHAGGVVPYIAYRLSTVAEEVKASGMTRDDIIASLKTLYYDVALSTDPSVFATLRDLVGTSHILFGTDYPMRYENGVTKSIKQLINYVGFSDYEKKQIIEETAKELFPKFR